MFFKFIFLSIPLLMLLAQGCAIGNKYNFSDTRAELQVAGPYEGNMAVATLDQREVVVSKECSPMYVGMQRAGFGNPWRVNTESGLPLADEVTRAVTESLNKKGFTAIPVYVAFNQSEDEALRSLLGKKSKRSVFIILEKWESDTYMNIGLEYDLRLKILDADQSVIAETAVADKKTIPGSFWDPPAAAKEQIPIAFKEVLEKLLNDPKVLAAIK